jgi:hypothetical protein
MQLISVLLRNIFYFNFHLKAEIKPRFSSGLALRRYLAIMQTLNLDPLHYTIPDASSYFPCLQTQEAKMSLSMTSGRGPEVPSFPLPAEMANNIFSFLSTETLESTISKVCSTWKSLAESMIELRVAGIERTIPPETLYELKTKILAGENKNEDIIKVLKEYERVYMGSTFQIHNAMFQRRKEE